MLAQRFVRQFSRTIKPYSLLLVFTLGAAGQQSYVFTKVLSNNSQRPDGNGVFNINYVTTPAFDGQWVVFKDYGNKDDGSLQALWSFNTIDATFHKLADLKTTAPGAATTFSDIQLPDTAPLVRKGTVIFVAHYITGAQLLQGLFAMPAAGGMIVKIADYSTADPTGGTFNRLGAFGSQAGGFSFDGATVVFAGQGSTSTNGAYSALPNGTSLAMVADTAHPFTSGGVSVKNFSTPTVSGNNVLLYGTDGTDPATGYNGLYLAMVGGNGTPTELVNSKQQLPGDTNATFHTRFDAPVLALDGMLAVFRADDPNAGVGVLYGLYTADLGSRTIGKIVDVNSTLTGLGKLSAIATNGVAASQGSVLFKAGDTAGANALYLWNGGSASRIVGRGDTLDGQSVVNVQDPGNASLYGQGFAFNVDFGSLLSESLYVAVPASTVVKLAAVMNSASYTSASIAPGEVVTLFGTGMGPATLAAYQLDANQRIATQLAGAQIAFNGYSAPLLYVSDKQSAAVVPFELAGAASAQVVVQYNGSSAAAVTVPVTNTMPGLFSASQGGSGPGAIQNSDQSYNSAANPAAAGSEIVLWIAGLGTIVPAQADGSFAGSPLPSLQFPVTVSIGGLPAQVVYSGPAPTAVAGLYQVNCVIPLGTPSGNAAVTVTADGRSSQPNLIVVVK